MLKTFKIGGIHPESNKLSACAPIQTLSLPKQVSIFVAQHIGAPAKTVVKRGDKVKVGTLLAEAGGFVSANIHSSVSGTVKKIDNVVDASGYRKTAIVIDVEGDEWEETIDKSDRLEKRIDHLTSEEIINKVGDMGIVGLGGATFPSKVKLMPPKGMVPSVVIINAVECEPYLTADHRLMLEKAEEIIVGVKLLMKATKVNQAIIGVENNKPDAIKKLQEVTQSMPEISICPLQLRYPQGGEKQLIDACINRQVASGALPISTGAIVQNVGTAFAIYEAVQKNKPLFERIVTVTGKSVAKPSNFKVRIGTSMDELIAAVGGLPEDTYKIIAGGPMMGKALVSTAIPTTKGSSGILLITDKEAARKPMSNCVRCGKCISACPMGLEPFLLTQLCLNGNFEKAEEEGVMDCIECGSCQYSCPANRPLTDYCRLGKTKVGAMRRARNK